MFLSPSHKSLKYCSFFLKESFTICSVRVMRFYENFSYASMAEHRVCSSVLSLLAIEMDIIV